MSDARYTITLDFKGKEELNSIVEKLLRKYDIDAEADFSKVAVGIEKNISSPMTRVKAQFAEWGLVINGIQGALQTVGMAYEKTIGTMVRAAQEQESAEITLKGALRATGLEVDNNARILGHYASSLQKATVYGDEMLMTSMAQMQNIARFDSVESLQRATKAAIGLSSAFGIDLGTAMDLVGKAAAGNTGMLGRYGLVLDENASQAEKFEMVLKRGLEYFPLAEDAANTSIGKMTQLKNTWGDFQETLATGVLPVMEGFVELMTPMIEAASAMSGEAKAMTLGLLLANAMVVKHTLAIMVQGVAYAALTLEQQAYVAQVFAVVATNKAATIGTISFSGAMGTVGASFVAAGTAAKGFLASIGSLGWIVIGITGAYVGLNAILKVNTSAMKDRYDVQRKTLEQNSEELSKKEADAKATMKLTERYQQLAGQAKLNKKEQGELAGIHGSLAEKYPNLISQTGSYSNSLKGVEGAAKAAKEELIKLSWQQWQNSLKMIKIGMEETRVETYETLVKDFNWRDIFFSGSRGIALAGVKADMQKLINSDSSTFSDAYLQNMAKRFEDLGKQSSNFNNGEQIALQKAAILTNTLIGKRSQYNAMLKEGAPKAVANSIGGSGSKEARSEEGQSEKNAVLQKAADFEQAKKLLFNEKAIELARLEEQLKKEQALVEGNEAAKESLRQNWLVEKVKIERKYQKAEEDATAAHFESLKFAESGYYAWKKSQIETEGKKLFPTNSSDREAWTETQVKSLDKDKKDFDNKIMIGFEGQYEAEMSHLAELRELGLVTYQEIADKAWEYYETLKLIVAADGNVSQTETDKLEVLKGRAQKAQLAGNRDSDLASYYNQVKFLDAGYYAWKKARVEEDVRMMQLSEDQKSVILKQRVKELDAERNSSGFRGKLFSAIAIQPSDQDAIVSQYQQIAGQISTIWGQLYSNMESSKNNAIKMLEDRAKTERRSEAWLSSEKEKINAEYEKKVRTMRRIEQKVQIASAMMNTAEGVTNALTLKPAWYAVPAAIAIGALGAVQVETIASQKFAEGGSPGLYKGKGTPTSDSNIIAISDHEYIISAERVKQFGLPFFDALNFGDASNVRKALSTIKINNPAQVVNRTINNNYSNGGEVKNTPSQNRELHVVLKCDSRVLAKAVARGNRQLLTLQ
ncbi:MAG: hypothetical protein PHY48_12790 [Candidatus Cloacimonetes bacterium]|nr:hypothetical protein [Candidatus Cloacimonadota bacterium]